MSISNNRWKRGGERAPISRLTVAAALDRTIGSRAVRQNREEPVQIAIDRHCSAPRAAWLGCAVQVMDRHLVRSGRRVEPFVPRGPDRCPAAETARRIPDPCRRTAGRAAVQFLHRTCRYGSSVKRSSPRAERPDGKCGASPIRRWRWITRTSDIPWKRVAAAPRFRAGASPRTRLHSRTPWREHRRNSLTMVLRSSCRDPTVMMTDSGTRHVTLLYGDELVGRCVRACQRQLSEEPRDNEMGTARPPGPRSPAPLGNLR